MNLELVILEGPQTGRRFPVGETPITIGRSADAAVSFPADKFISGMHASVQTSAQGVLVNDLHSTNGTYLNGQRISQAVAEIGDVVQVGTLSFQVARAQSPSAQPVPAPSSAPVAPADPVVRTVRSETQFALPPMAIPVPPLAPSGTTTIPRIQVDSSPLPFKVPPPAPQPKPPQRAVVDLLETIFSPLYLLVNAAADPGIPALLAAAGYGLPQYSLWEAEAGAPLPPWVPYLLPIAPQAPILQSLLSAGWGKGWVCFFTSDAPFEDLRQHFAKFLKVQMQGRGEVYFRFYDPRVLREFLPAANPAELAMFFGATSEWFLEGENEATMLRVQPTAGGLLTSVINLA